MHPDNRRSRHAYATDTQKPVWVTPNEAVRLTGIGRTLIYRLIRDRTLKSIKLGGKRLISFASIQDLDQHASDR
jgi:excisionase family DNA binding protein